MPREGEYSASGGQGINFTSNVECGFDESGGKALCVPGPEGCPPDCGGGCEMTYDGRWHDDSITVQDMRERPEAVQTCPVCGHRQLMEYPGWGNYADA